MPLKFVPDDTCVYLTILTLTNEEVQSSLKRAFGER